MQTLFFCEFVGRPTSSEVAPADGALGHALLPATLGRVGGVVESQMRREGATGIPVAIKWCGAVKRGVRFRT